MASSSRFSTGWASSSGYPIGGACLVAYPLHLDLPALQTPGERIHGAGRGVGTPVCCGRGRAIEGKGAAVTARFGEDGIVIVDPNRVAEGPDAVFEKIYDKPV